MWPQATSILGVEMASGQPPGKLITSSSDMTTAAASSEVNEGMVALRLIPSCSNGLSPSVSMGPPMCEGPGTSGRAGAPLQALFHLRRCRPCGYRWPPSEMNAADKPC